jgi:hypothetical protein
MFRRFVEIGCVGVFLVMGLVSPLKAQESAMIRAVATVLPSMTIIGTNSLDFDYVIPDVRKSVEKTDIGHAGEWTISGSPESEITLKFDLPDSLRSVRGSSAMKIGFSIADASFDDGFGAGQTAPAGVLNPYAISTRSLSWDGNMTVWIGGTVFPTRTQIGGTYTGQIVLTATYTGN